jgi:hypothetical protein
VIRTILDSKPHPEMGDRACLGLLRLEKTYSEQRLETASQRALQLQACSYSSLHSILKRSLCRQTTLAPELGEPGPRHENLRHHSITIVAPFRLYSHRAGTAIHIVEIRKIFVVVRHGSSDPDEALSSEVSLRPEKYFPFDVVSKSAQIIRPSDSHPKVANSRPLCPDSARPSEHNARISESIFPLRLHRGP